MMEIKTKTVIASMDHWKEVAVIGMWRMGASFDVIALANDFTLYKVQCIIDEHCKKNNTQLFV